MEFAIFVGGVPVIKFTDYESTKLVNRLQLGIVFV